MFHRNRTIILAGRNLETGDKLYFLVNDFYPRGYVEKTEGKHSFMGKLAIKDEGKKHYMTDNAMLTVYLKDTGGIYNLRKVYEKTFETDIPFEAVFKFEKHIGKHFGIPDLDSKVRILEKFVIISHTEIEVKS